MGKYTVVRHSGVTTGHDEFAQGLQSAAVASNQEKRVLDAGGVLFDTYGEAEDFADREQYPSGHSGLIPAAPGTFSPAVKGLLPLYIPPKREAALVPVLGDYVQDAVFPYRGRITQVHHRCPQDKEWLAEQSDKSVHQHVDEPWVSILIHDGGAVVRPRASVRVIEPFAFSNPYADLYFRES